MPNKFVSNNELIKLIEKATDDERLGLTKLFDTEVTIPYDAKVLQEKISMEGGHSFGNWFRSGQGTGYLDILDDVAKELKIKNEQSYKDVKYFDELFLLQSENNPKYSLDEATKLGNEYAEKLEDKIIVELIKRSYELLIKQKEDYESKLEKLDNNKKSNLLELKYYMSIANIFDNDSTFLENDSLNKEYKKVNTKVEDCTKKDTNFDKEYSEIDKLLEDVSNRIKDFDNAINDVSKEFDGKNIGLGTATGVMVLANLGGFATYTFLTSMMSVVSMGTLGFGAYTTATSLLSILIGPVGWAGLVTYALFSFGKPKMSKLIPLVATIGAIRQRLKYENENLRISC